MKMSRSISQRKIESRGNETKLWGYEKLFYFLKVRFISSELLALLWKPVTILRSH